MDATGLSHVHTSVSVPHTRTHACNTRTPTGAIPVQPTSPTYLPARIPLHVGVLHYSPTQEPFPLLADPERLVMVLLLGVEAQTC